MAGDMIRGTIFLVGVFFAAAAHAADAGLMADPTRPPAAAYVGGAGVESGKRLSSVVLPKNGRPAAVIGGQVVPLGGMVGDARLVRVTENEAILEGPEGIEHLYLTPDVEKKVNKTKAAVRRNKE